MDTLSDGDRCSALGADAAGVARQVIAAFLTCGSTPAASPSPDLVANWYEHQHCDDEPIGDGQLVARSVPTHIAGAVRIANGERAEAQELRLIVKQPRLQRIARRKEPERFWRPIIMPCNACRTDCPPHRTQSAGRVSARYASAINGSITAHPYHNRREAQQKRQPRGEGEQTTAHAGMLLGPDRLPNRSAALRAEAACVAGEVVAALHTASASEMGTYPLARVDEQPQDRQKREQKDGAPHREEEAVSRVSSGREWRSELAVVSVKPKPHTARREGFSSRRVPRCIIDESEEACVPLGVGDPAEFRMDLVLMALLVIKEPIVPSLAPPPQRHRCHAQEQAYDRRDGEQAAAHDGILTRDDRRL